MRIAVAGGTGWIGRLVVEAAREQGHTPVVIARSHGVDLLTGAGLEAALAGAEAVVDVTNLTTTSRRKAITFFTTATTNLLRAAERAQVRHLVTLSVAGCDRVGLGYYAGKLRQEELVQAGPIPATIQRATQFHEFAAQLLGNAVGPFVPVPRMLSRPVAAREVAALLVPIAAGPALGTAPEIAGPQPLPMVDLVRQVVRARGLRKVVVPLTLPGAVGRAMAGGDLLPTGPGPRGTETFDAWLARSR